VKPLAQALRMEIRLAFVKMVRYPLQTLTSLLVVYILFIGMFYGSRFLAGVGKESYAGFSHSATQAITGYVLWFLSLFAIDSMSQNIAEEAQTGTIEQLYLSRWDFSLMLFLRFTAAFLASLAMLVPLFFLLVLTTGVSFAWQLGTAIPVIAVTAIGLCGMGYLLGALTLIFKRIGNAMTLVQFVLLFLCLPPVEQLPAPLRYFALSLPLTQGIQLLRSTAPDSSSQIHLSNVLTLVMTALVYLGIGLTVFRWAEATAKERGLLGHY
jgi:ABC-2 type transport system permease protein